jgi:hypothetical protein
MMISLIINYRKNYILLIEKLPKFLNVWKKFFFFAFSFPRCGIYIYFFFCYEKSIYQSICWEKEFEWKATNFEAILWFGWLVPKESLDVWNWKKDIWFTTKHYSAFKSHNATSNEVFFVNWPSIGVGNGSHQQTIVV